MGERGPGEPRRGQVLREALEKAIKPGTLAVVYVGELGHPDERRLLLADLGGPGPRDVGEGRFLVATSIRDLLGIRPDQLVAVGQLNSAEHAELAVVATRMGVFDE